uniref:Uncharacterized protein LOC104216361 n=1 Tax=Nicotiana sylvestris TaxID=4096 RepID=A0A1U7VIE5_NICSY|nr:PREDICTED: uncharacterized protein LOC104216361 [Nicotiana sylvestris]
MVEEIMQVFMDDFSVVGNSFDGCLMNLKRVLKRFMKTKRVNLVLGFMPIADHVLKGIILGKVSFHGTGRYSLGTPSVKIAFEELKKSSVSAPIIIAPDWEQPFELIYDVSDYVVGAVLGQQKDKLIHPIYYASRTLSGAQLNCTVTKKEMLAVVFAFDKFRSYLIGSKIRDRKGTENQVADQILAPLPQVCDRALGTRFLGSMTLSKKLRTTGASSSGQAGSSRLRSSTNAR